MPATPILQHSVTGRSTKALSALVVMALLLLGLWVVFDASLIWICLGVLVTLPTLWEFLIAKPAGLTLTETDLSWFSGRLNSSIALSEIDTVRLDTRLDFSVRVTIVPKTGRKQRLPHDSLPKASKLEAALNGLGVATKRQHFSLIG